MLADEAPLPQVFSCDGYVCHHFALCLALLALSPQLSPGSESDGPVSFRGLGSGGPYLPGRVPLFGKEIDQKSCIVASCSTSKK